MFISLCVSTCVCVSFFVLLLIKFPSLALWSGSVEDHPSSSLLITSDYTEWTPVGKNHRLKSTLALGLVVFLDLIYVHTLSHNKCCFYQQFKYTLFTKTHLGSQWMKAPILFTRKQYVTLKTYYMLLQYSGSTCVWKYAVYTVDGLSSAYSPMGCSSGGKTKTAVTLAETLASQGETETLAVLLVEAKSMTYKGPLERVTTHLYADWKMQQSQNSLLGRTFIKQRFGEFQCFYKQHAPTLHLNTLKIMFPLVFCLIKFHKELIWGRNKTSNWSYWRV